MSSHGRFANARRPPSPGLYRGLHARRDSLGGVPRFKGHSLVCRPSTHQSPDSFSATRTQEDAPRLYGLVFWHPVRPSSAGAAPPAAAASAADAAPEGGGGGAEVGEGEVEARAAAAVAAAAAAAAAGGGGGASRSDAPDEPRPSPPGSSDTQPPRPSRRRSRSRSHSPQATTLWERRSHSRKVRRRAVQRCKSCES